MSDKPEYGIIQRFLVENLITYGFVKNGDKKANYSARMLWLKKKYGIVFIYENGTFKLDNENREKLKAGFEATEVVNNRRWGANYVSKHAISEETRAHIIAFIKQGFTVRRIAEALSEVEEKTYSLTDLQTIFQKNGIKMSDFPRQVIAKGRASKILGSPWSPAAIDYLRQLVEEGFSSSRIAEALSAKFNITFSRNSVIGKRERLGLKMLPEARGKIPFTRKKTINLEEKKHKNANFLRVPSPSLVPDNVYVAPLSVQKGEAYFEELSATGEFTKSLTDLGAFDCHFTTGGIYSFCGKPTTKRDGYCPSCQAGLATKQKLNPIGWHR